MAKLDQSLFEKLTQPGPRLPWIKKWLIDEIWSLSRYRSSKITDFLFQGEEVVNSFESLISSAAGRVYDELTSPSDSRKNLLDSLTDAEKSVVIFDGLSLREIPVVITLAERSGLKVLSVDCSVAATPSETTDFIDREFACGQIGPSQIQGRRELRDRGICAFYHGDYNHPFFGDYDGHPLLLWSPFPDSTYRDTGAKFINHFENIHAFFENVWMNTVQQIKGKKRIVVTSDHGYVFFGTGMDFLRSQAEIKALNEYFGNERWISLSKKPDPPASDDVYIDTLHKVAMIKGRVKTKSTGEAASKLYKHGGLSLMEMITPWIELETK
jgi:hypothetical protein